jgi:hypothetical protein
VRARRGLAVAGVLVAGLAVSGCSDDAPSDAAAPGDGSTSTEVTTTTAPTTTTATVAERSVRPLQIVEQGLSTFPDPIDPSRELGGYGVVLANPNPDVMAAGVRVVTRVLDGAGAELLSDSALLNGILPGAQMAVGRTLIEPIEGATSLTVELEVSAWLAPASSDGRLVAEDVVTEPEEAGGSVTRFTVRSTWPEEEDGVDVTAVYRAADGRILSAESTSVAVVPADDTVASQIRLLTPIPDLATTEVFVGRGFDALTIG